MPNKIPVAKLMDGASFLFAVQPESITGPRRIKHVFYARAAVALAARLSGRTYQQIGEILGGRNHKAAMNAVERAQELYDTDEKFRAKCDSLLAMVGRFEPEPPANDNAADLPPLEDTAVFLARRWIARAKPEEIAAMRCLLNEECPDAE